MALPPNTRESVVALSLGEGGEANIIVDTRVRDEKFKVNMITARYDYDQMFPYYADDVTDAFRRAINEAVAQYDGGTRFKVRIRFTDEIWGQGYLNNGFRKGSDIVSFASTNARDMNNDQLWDFVRAKLAKEDQYDAADGIDFDDDYNAAAKEEEAEDENLIRPPNRLSAVSIILLEYTMPEGGAMKYAGRSTKQIIGFDVKDDLCGQACLAYHESNVVTKGNMGKANRPAYAYNKAKEIADELGCHGMMTLGDFELYTEIHPSIRIVIFDANKDTIYDTGITSIFPNNVYLLLDNNHYYLIKNVQALMKKTVRERTKWCHMCAALIRTIDFNTHKCEGDKCSSCHYYYKDEDEKREHASIEKGEYCPRCCTKLRYAACLDKHTCPYLVCRYCDKAHAVHKASTHRCGEKYCNTCKVYTELGTVHRCFISNLVERTDVINEENSPYYAYDIESTIDDDGIHAIALMVVTQLYSRKTVILENVDEVLEWMDNHNSRAITMIAHNSAEYDAPLLFQAFMGRAGAKPEGMIFVGEKLIYMRYGQIGFIDSRRHFSGSLASLVKTFGLQCGKKGWFPYEFFTPARRWYVGEVPELMYFTEKTKSDPDFAAWYAGWEGKQYSIDNECKTYCAQDVTILASALEGYQASAIALNALDPLKKITIASYAFSVYRSLFMPEKSIQKLTKPEYEFCRTALQGGRTEAFQLHREWTDEEIASGRYGSYADVMSLYPTVQMYDPLPGHIIEEELNGAELVGEEAIKYVRTHDGTRCLAIFEYDIVPPRDLHIPLLLVKHEGKLSGTLFPIKGARGTSVEVLRALEMGYTDLKIRGRISFIARKDLFASYVARFIARKKLYAPSGEEPNPGMYKLCKLILNSLWGRFASRSFDTEYRTVSSTKAWYKLVHQYQSYKCDVDILQFGGTYLLTAITDPLKGENYHLATTSVALAAFVTANARLRLYEELNKLGDRVMYCDTDSIVYEHLPDAYNILIGSELGSWTDETNGNPIREYVALGPKTWGYRDTNGNGEVKSKGFSAGWATLDMYKKLLADDSLCETITTTRFSRKCKRKMLISTSTSVKRLKFTFNKRFVVSHSLTLPYGHVAISDSSSEPSEETDDEEAALDCEMDDFIEMLLDSRVDNCASIVEEELSLDAYINSLL